MCSYQEFDYPKATETMGQSPGLKPNYTCSLYKLNDSQKVNFGSYDNYIPVSELSKKSWNQQHFALAFPKPPRPGKKKRSLPSQQSDIRAPITEDGRLGSHRPPLWMHRSLMRISERPSVYLAARRKPPPIPSQSSMGDSKEAIAKIPASPSASKKPQKGKSDSESEPKVKATVLKKSQDSLESEAEKATSKKGAKKEKDAKGIDSTTASEDDRAASKKGAKKDKKDAKGKDSATTSEDGKAASKKGTKKDKKDAKGQDSTTASEDDKAALRKGSRKNDKAGKKSKEGNTDSEGEKGGDKKGKKDLKKDQKNKKEDKKGSSADSESKDDIKKDLKKENKKGSKNKKRAKKGSDVESVESKKGGKKGK